ncbi:hypothetical protein, partial [Corynebacterium flavescens]|uniref:hypothetical protein n=1 Tax=Corynebacterium flavescens TaxID=28028 RepID=UPI002648D8EC
RLLLHRLGEQLVRLESIFKEIPAKGIWPTVHPLSCRYRIQYLPCVPRGWWELGNPPADQWILAGWMRPKFH